MAPRIYQEHIREGLLLRVFVAGPRVFTSRIAVEHGREPPGSPQSVFAADHRLAPEVESRCRLLLRRLGLLFAAVDLALTLDGRHIFLSLDPAPFWRRIEEQTGQPISDALVELLIPYDERTSHGSKPGAPAAYG
jgi:glutathione synthase/RimK-type ligase-like ATP-grasp enzyme